MEELNYSSTLPTTATLFFFQIFHPVNLFFLFLILSVIFNDHLYIISLMNIFTTTVHQNLDPDLLLTCT